MELEESWEHTPEPIQTHCEHPLRRIASGPSVEWQNPTLHSDYQDLIAVHSAIKNVQEIARAAKKMGSSLQSFVHVVAPADDSSVLTRYLSELPDLFVASSVTLGSPRDPLPDSIDGSEWKYTDQFELSSGAKGTVYVYAPQASKCPRCWRYAVHEATEEQLCDRCDGVVHAAA